MKIGFNPGSIVDANGSPLQGRVLVYVHDSLEKKDIFTMEGSEYVASENPVLLDTTGRIPNTLFFDVGVVDVLVQKYVGAPGQLADESPDEDFEDFDRFEAGFDFDPSQAGTTDVDTIADLKDIENPSGVVRVNCYTTPGDTFPRYYLWNPNCTASEDGGCVIADTHDASGMWCYLCEGDSIKSSVYGIKPGTEETNLGAFCAAPLGVSGDYTIAYPTTLYMESGTYTNGNSYNVTNGRKMLFSCRAKFTASTFYGLDFDVDGHNLDYVADFYIMSSDKRTKVRARSSWFRTATYFWTCGAGILNLDKTNYFEFNSIGSMVGPMNAVIIGSFNLYSPTFVNSGYLDFTNCTFIGRAIFDKSNLRARFTNCNFSDYLFSGANYNNVDFGTIAGGHNIEVDSWKVTDAQNADVWLAWANAAGMGFVDLCGRSVTTLYNSNISEFRNGVFLGGVVSTNVNVKFTDIGGSLSVWPTISGKSLTLDHCDSVSIMSDTPFSSIVARDSIVVVSADIDTSITSYSHDGGAVQATFKCAGWAAPVGTHPKGNEVNLRNVVLNIGNFSWFDNLRMQNCTVNNPIQVIPYYENSDLWLDAIFVGNTFGNNGYIAFGDSSVGNVDIYGVKVKNLIIKDNVFNTSGNGVMMPFYAYNSVVNVYIAPLQELNATYSGNVGSCPAESIDYGPDEMQALYTRTQGSYKRNEAVRRVWNLSKYAVFEHGSGLRISADDTQSKFVTPYLYHERNVENAGDQFDVFVAVKSDDYVNTSIFKAFDK